MRISRKALERGGERGDLTPEESRLLLSHQLSEAEFQAHVVHLARSTGWLVYHTYRSDRSDKGFYDLFLLHPKRGRLLLAELKKQDERQSPEQRVWADAAEHFAVILAAVLAHIPASTVKESDPTTWPVAYFLWRPFDWPEIERTLT